MRSTRLLAQEEEKKEFLVVLPCTHVTDQWFECVAVKFLYYLPPSPPIHQLPFFYATSLQIGS